MHADGLYAGLDVHRAARVMSAAHGGQVLLSERTADLVDGELGAGLSLVPVGEHRLKDLAQAQRLFQAVGVGLQSDFPPPKGSVESSIERRIGTRGPSRPTAGRRCGLSRPRRSH